MYTLVTVMLIIMSSSAEPFLSAWARGVDILIHAVTDSAMVDLRAWVLQLDCLS